jgi:F-type H+-transporting ATPase subunit delta
MTARSVAVRYARALVEAVGVEADLDRVQRELGEFSALLGGHEELRSALTSPVIPDAQKRKVGEAVFELAGLHPTVRRLLALLAVNGRLGSLDLVRQEIETLADARRRIVAAEMVTAVPIPEARVEDYRRALERVTGRTVRLRRRVNPAIMGGVVTRIGSRVYDGSLKGKLERLHEQLRGE